MLPRQGTGPPLLSTAADEGQERLSHLPQVAGDREWEGVCPLPLSPDGR